MKLPRIIHRIYAGTFGYFWLPCPICGENFGGHETRWRHGVLYTEPGKGWMTCTKLECAMEAKRRSEPIIHKMYSQHVLHPSSQDGDSQ
jgi:hypothetical protein